MSYDLNQEFGLGLKIKDIQAFIPEGNELAVLRGAHDTIIDSDYPPIIFESNSHAWNVKHKSELFNYLQVKFGYSIGEIKPFNNMFIAAIKDK